MLVMFAFKRMEVAMLTNHFKLGKRVINAIQAILIILAYFFLSYPAFCAELVDELISASINNDTQKVKELIAKGADINEKDEYGNTAISYAVEAENYDCIKILIKNGADVNNRNIGGWSPLIIATKNGDADIVKILLDSGADPNLKGGYGWTALMIAAWLGHKEVAQELLIKNANLQVENKWGRTALYIAELFEKKEIIELLTAPVATQR